jgi:hypothetical protein
MQFHEKELFKSGFELIIPDCLVVYICTFFCRYLLGFGQVSYYLGYSALTDFFPKMYLRPNPDCDDSFCQQRQAEVKALPPKEQESDRGTSFDDKEVTHEDNEWGTWNTN